MSNNPEAKQPGRSPAQKIRIMVEWNKVQRFVLRVLTASTNHYCKGAGRTMKRLTALALAGVLLLGTACGAEIRRTTQQHRQ